MWLSLVCSTDCFVHPDVRTCPVVLVNGMKYFVTLVDCCYIMTWVYLVCHIEEVFTCFQSFLCEIFVKCESPSDSKMALVMHIVQVDWMIDIHLKILCFYGGNLVT
jgi:hypothetical protein